MSDDIIEAMDIKLVMRMNESKRDLILKILTHLRKWRDDGTTAWEKLVDPDMCVLWDLMKRVENENSTDTATTKQKYTRFSDCHSHGGRKENFEVCYIQAPEDDACLIFYKRFDHNPFRVSCTCCGPDYSVEEDSHPSDYGMEEKVLIINRDEFTKDEWEAVLNKEEMPQQGYVWVGG